MCIYINAECWPERSFKNFCNVHKKTPVLESLFYKVAGLKVCSFIKKRLQHMCFSVKFAILKTLFYRIHLVAASGKIS